MRAHRRVYMPSHSRATASGEVDEHVLVAEAALGKALPRGAHIHHVDENPRNNLNRNLVICQDAAYHRLLHVRARVVRAGGDPDSQRLCSTCKRLKLLSEFNKASANVNGGVQQSCRECSHAYTKTYKRKPRAA